MKISLERSGGVAGLRIKKEINTSTLSRKEVNQINRWIESSDFFRLPKKIKTRTVQPDRFQYKLTIRKTEKKHTIEVVENDLTDPLRSMVDWLSRTA